MGHSQCASSADHYSLTIKTSGQQTGRLRSLTFRCVPTPGDSMILPISVPVKSLSTAQFENKKLDPRRNESSQNAADLQKAMSHLHESGWYWGPLNAAQAAQVLTEYPEGTFLLRDSSYPGYLLTLSVMTSIGPTHIRIEYSGGLFGFDSLMVARPRLRQFGSAVDLIQHYSLTYKHLASQKAEKETGHTVNSGPDHSLQLKLTQPLFKGSPSLQHLCRVTINHHSRSHQHLPLPGRLLDFLLEYPFVL
ncbi:suppressor of cytokine signaling 2-like isoform X2 [Hypomesus transpacificus]|nr:suppressor of cytokine signaling 2-like isoform X2 [Hypomesus transpacificus]